MNVRELAVSLGLDVDHSGFAEAGELIHELTHGFMGAVAAVGALALGLAEVTRETAAHGHEVTEAAERIGIATDKLQELQYAARMSGLGDGQLEFALRAMGRAARGAAAGSGQAAFVFHKMGISIQELRHLKPDEVLSRFADGFAKLPGGMEKSNAALTLFGRGGSMMIPMLNKLGEEGSELAKAAHASGNVLSESQLKAADAFVNAQRRFNETMQGLRNAIGTPLLGALTGIVDKFAQWVSESRKLMATGVVMFAKLLGAVLLGLYKTLELIGKGWKMIWELGAAAKTAIMTFALVASFMLAPWMTFLVFLGLVADDVHAFVTGHRSAIGVVIEVWRAYKKQVEDTWEAFKKHPLDFLFTEFERLFNFILEKIKSIPEELAKSSKNPGVLEWLGTLAHVYDVDERKWKIPGFSGPPPPLTPPPGWKAGDPLPPGVGPPSSVGEGLGNVFDNIVAKLGLANISPNMTGGVPFAGAMGIAAQGGANIMVSGNVINVSSLHDPKVHAAVGKQLLEDAARQLQEQTKRGGN